MKALELSLALPDRQRPATTRSATVSRTTDGQPGLVLDVTPKSYAPPFLYLAFDLQNIDSNSFSADFRGRTVFTDVVNAGSELTRRLHASARTSTSAPSCSSRWAGRGSSSTLGGGRFFFMPRAYFSRESVNGYVDDELVAEYTVKTTGGGFDVGFTSGRRNQVRLGYDIQDVARPAANRDSRPAGGRGREPLRVAALHVRWLHDAGRADARRQRRGEAVVRYFDAPQPTSDAIAGLRTST